MIARRSSTPRMSNARMMAANSICRSTTAAGSSPAGSSAVSSTAVLASRFHWAWTSCQATLTVQFVQPWRLSKLSIRRRARSAAVWMASSTVSGGPPRRRRIRCALAATCGQASSQVREEFAVGANFSVTDGPFDLCIGDAFRRAAEGAGPGEVVARPFQTCGRLRGLAQPA